MIKMQISPLNQVLDYTWSLP